MEPANTDRCIAWARETYAEMEPFVASGRYVNYLGDDEPGDPIAAAYGPNYRRLRGSQDEVRPEQFLPHEPEHSPIVVSRAAPGEVVVEALVLEVNEGPRSGELGAHALGEERDLLVEVGAVRGQELEHQMLDAGVTQLADAVYQHSGLARRHASAVDRGRDRPARPRRAGRVAQSHRGRHRAAAQLAEPFDLGTAGAQLLRGAVDRMPAAPISAARRSEARA